MTCFDLIHYDGNACAWDIIIEYVVCSGCACEIIQEIAQAIFGHYVEFCWYPPTPTISSLQYSLGQRSDNFLPNKTVS